MDHQHLLDRVMDLDENIRYGTICDMNGQTVCTSKRVETLLSPQETQDTLQHAVSAWKSRMKHYDKTGKGLYTLAVYENLRRVTFPIKGDHLLLVTIDNKGGKSIIDRVLNELHGDYTME